MIEKRDNYLVHLCISEEKGEGGIIEFQTYWSGYTTARCRYCGKIWTLNELLNEIKKNGVLNP